MAFAMCRARQKPCWVLTCASLRTPVSVRRRGRAHKDGLMDCGNYLAGDIAASRIRRDGGNGWLTKVAAAKDCVMELAQWVGVACGRNADRLD